VLRSGTQQRGTVSRAAGVISPVRSSQTISALTGLRPREIGRVEARLKQSLRSADALKGSHDMQREGDEAAVIEVRQLTLGLRPDELVRIEFRRITWEPVHVQPGMAAEEDLDVPPPMDFPAIPQQHEWSSEMPKQLPKERDDFGPRDVAHVEVEVQAEAAAPRGHRERRNDGDFVPSVAMPELRRATDGRPGFANIGDEQEAALIDEHEMRAASSGVFLSVEVKIRSDSAVSRGLGVRCTALFAPPHATSSFSFAKGTLSRNVCRGVLP
jgi:hypothetical protein